MKKTTYKDNDGRNWWVYLPDNAPSNEANTGIPIGPPSLEDLEIPKSFEVALHNQLFNRKIFTSADIKRRRADVVSAIRSAYKTDSETLYAHYLKWEGNL